MTQSDIEDSFKSINNNPNPGNPESQYQLALSYFCMKGEESRKKGLKLLRRAADLCHEEATVKLGSCYERGIGTEQDYKKAAKFYRQAANNHHVVAQFLLAGLYEQGLGVEPDLAIAAELYRNAAKSNHAEAKRKLASFYEQGLGVIKDQEQAMKWYRQSADQGNAAAQTILGHRYRQGIGVTADPVLAMDWYKSAAKLDYPAALESLGYCYQHGVGVGKDEEQAIKWYQMAADKGCAPSQYQMGYCYEHGIGVEKNMETAVKWYVKAASVGHLGAQYMMAHCYEQGIGVEKDEAMAEYWYNNSLSGDYGDDGKEKNKDKIPKDEKNQKPPPPNPKGRKKSNPEHTGTVKHVRKLTAASKKSKHRSPWDPKKESLRIRKSSSRNPSESLKITPLPSNPETSISETPRLYSTLTDVAAQLVGLCDDLTRPPADPGCVLNVNRTLEELMRLVGQLEEVSSIKKATPLFVSVKAFRDAAVKGSVSAEELKEQLFNVLHVTQEFTEEIEKLKSAGTEKSGFLLEVDYSAPNSVVTTNRGVRDMIMDELFTTEKSYGEGLELATSLWAEPLRELSNTKRSIATTEQIGTMFSSLETLCKLHKMLLVRLEEKKDNIGEIFCQFAEMMKLYIDYVNKYENMAKTYNNLSTNKQFRIFDFEASSKSGKGPLMGILITPVQRLPRYQLLLETLLKNTETSHSDFQNLENALQKMCGVNHAINEKKRDYENRKKISQIAATVKTSGKEKLALVAPHRVYVCSGSLAFNFRGQGKKNGYVYVMNDMVLVASVETNGGGGEDDIQHYVTTFRISDLVLTNTDRNEFFLSIGTKFCIFFPENTTEKEKWITTFNETIRNYTLSVPSDISLDADSVSLPEDCIVSEETSLRDDITCVRRSHSSFSTFHRDEVGATGRCGGGEEYNLFLSPRKQKSDPGHIQSSDTGTQPVPPPINVAKNKSNIPRSQTTSATLEQRIKSLEDKFRLMEELQGSNSQGEDCPIQNVDPPGTSVTHHALWNVEKKPMEDVMEERGDSLLRINVLEEKFQIIEKNYLNLKYENDSSKSKIHELTDLSNFLQHSIVQLLHDQQLPEKMEEIGKNVPELQKIKPLNLEEKLGSSRKVRKSKTKTKTTSDLSPFPKDSDENKKKIRSPRSQVNLFSKSNPPKTNIRRKSLPRGQSINLHSTEERREEPSDFGLGEEGKSSNVPQRRNSMSNLFGNAKMIKEFLLVNTKKGEKYHNNLSESSDKIAIFSNMMAAATNTTITISAITTDPTTTSYPTSTLNPTSTTNAITSTTIPTAITITSPNSHSITSTSSPAVMATITFSTTTTTTATATTTVTPTTTITPTNAIITSPTTPTTAIITSPTTTIKTTKAPTTIKTTKAPTTTLKTTTTNKENTAPTVSAMPRRDLHRSATVVGVTSNPNKSMSPLSPLTNNDPLSTFSNGHLFTVSSEEKELEKFKCLFHKLGYMEYVGNFISNGIVNCKGLVEMKQEDWIRLGVKSIHKAKISAAALEIVGKS